MKAIAIDNEIKQGDIPAPTLFRIYFATIFVNDFYDCDKGVNLRFQTSG